MNISQLFTKYFGDQIIADKRSKIRMMFCKFPFSIPLVMTLYSLFIDEINTNPKIFHTLMKELGILLLIVSTYSRIYIGLFPFRHLH